MSSRSNLSQWIGHHVQDGRSGGRATRIGTMVLDTAAVRIGSCGVGASARDRALAGLRQYLVYLNKKYI